MIEARRSSTTFVPDAQPAPKHFFIHAADNAAALLFGLCSWVGAHLILPTYVRPYPGYALRLPSGSVFVRDPAHCEPFVPDSEATVPSWQLDVIIAAGPFVLVPLAHFTRREAHIALPMYAWAIGLTQLATELLKAYVGRLRPNFYTACGWDESIQACVWDDPAYQPAAARHSFPSGHSSLTISAGLLVTLYALGVLPAMQPTLHPSISTWGNRHHYVRLLFSRALTPLALMPTVLAVFVAASRVRDNWHFPADVISGIVLGASVSAFVYRRYLVLPSARPGYRVVETKSPAEQQAEEGGP